jgi:hypothetical protein
LRNSSLRILVAVCNGKAFHDGTPPGAAEQIVGGDNKPIGDAARFETSKWRSPEAKKGMPGFPPSPWIGLQRTRSSHYLDKRLSLWPKRLCEHYNSKQSKAVKKYRGGIKGGQARNPLAVRKNRNPHQSITTSCAKAQGIVPRPDHLLGKLLDKLLSRTFP